MSRATAALQRSSLDVLGLAATAHEQLVPGLRLRRCAPAAVLAGSLRGSPVELRVETFRGDRIRYARFVTLTGAGLRIANLLALPEPETGGPLFGADLVDTGKPTVLLVADLSPVPGVTAAPSGVRRCELPSAGTLPAWADGVFSSDHLFARVERDDARAAPAFLQYPAAFARWMQRPLEDDVDPERTRTFQRASLRAHREEDRAMRLLHTLFGDARAEELLTRVLFPEHLP